MGKFIKVVALMLSEDELETVRAGLKNCSEPQKLVQDVLFKVEEQLERFATPVEVKMRHQEGMTLPKEGMTLPKF